MLSYRHLFHAGNPADVFKHTVQVLILEYLKIKDKPFVYIDTHAYSALYDLTTTMAQKNSEYLGGIAKIYDDINIPNELSSYISCVKSFNSSPKCLIYPGSAAIAKHMLRTTSNRLQKLTNKFKCKKLQNIPH